MPLNEFSADFTARLNELSRAVGDRGFFFDFDGTLASIVDDPEHARPVPGMAEVLDQLRDHGARVTIVSARPVAFLRQHIDQSVEMFGLYGLEHGRPDRPVEVSPSVERWAPAIAEIVRRADSELAPLGVRIEDKRLAVALHFRAVPGCETVVRAWATKVANSQLGIVNGHMVIELIAPGGEDKGAIVGSRLAALGSAWYFGDDQADIGAFNAVKAERLRRPDFLGVAVAVAVHSSEASKLVQQAADLVIGSPHELVVLLTGVVKAQGGFI